MPLEFNELFVKLGRNKMLFALFKTQNDKFQKVISAAIPQVVTAFNKDGSKPEIENFARMLLSWLEETVSPDKFKQWYLGIILSQNVEAFDFYIAEMLTKVFTQRPEILNFSEFKIDMSEVLQCSSIEEVIFRVAERKVLHLSYQGFPDIIMYLNEKFKLGFDTKMPEFVDVCEMFLTRNIIVHNSGYINGIYLQKSKRKDLKVGDAYPLTEEYVEDGAGKILDVGLTLDKLFTSHFRLS